MTAPNIEHPTQLLTYLRRHNHIAAAENVTITPLAGGVFNRTVFVRPHALRGDIFLTLRVRRNGKGRSRPLRGRRASARDSHALRGKQSCPQCPISNVLFHPAALRPSAWTTACPKRNKSTQPVSISLFQPEPGRTWGQESPHYSLRCRRVCGGETWKCEGDALDKRIAGNSVLNLGKIGLN